MLQAHRGVVAILMVAALIAPANIHAAEKAGSRKIVTYKNGLVETADIKSGIGPIKESKIKDLDFINSDVAYLTDDQVKELSKDPRIERIENDVIFSIQIGDSGQMTQPQSSPSLDPTPAPAPGEESTPWGVEKIGAPSAWGKSTGGHVKVAILDTGIDQNHPDLKDNIKGGANMVNEGGSYTDDNGHGSHVAGTVAGEKNDVGVIGVGPNIDLYAVKVLGRDGSGSSSGIISGIEWAVKNNMSVINLSLGTKEDSPGMHTAIQKAAQSGITVVVAAGNDSGAVSYPAAYPEVIAVSATDSSDKIAQFSSRGKEIGFSAPGVDIYSSYKGSQYKTESGTSMASPHIAGAAAMVISQPIGSNDKNGNMRWDVDEVRAKLASSVTDLGTPGKDDLYGYGIVNLAKIII